MRILVVEDQRKMANFIQRGLKEEKYAVDSVYDAEKALYAAHINEYDLIVLDVMLPGKDGFYVCREIRKMKITTPILMLTSRDATEDKITIYMDKQQEINFALMKEFEREKISFAYPTQTLYVNREEALK